MTELRPYVLAAESFALSPQGHKLACAEDAIVVLDLRDDARKTIVDKFQYRNIPLCFVDEEQLLYVNARHELVRYDLRTDERTTVHTFDTEINAVRVHGAQLAAGGKSKSVWVLGLDGTVGHELKGCRAEIRDLQFFPRSPRIAATGDRKIHIWDLTHKKPKSVAIEGLTHPGAQISISEDETYVCATEYHSASSVHVFRLDSAALAFSSPNVGSAVFHDGRMVVINLLQVLSLSTSDWARTPIDVPMEYPRRLASGSRLVIRTPTGVCIERATSSPATTVQGLDNVGPIDCIYVRGDHALTVAGNDVVLRSLAGHGSRRLTVRVHDLPVTLRQVLPTRSDDRVWLVGDTAASMLDIPAWKLVGSTEYFKGTTCVAFRMKDHTVFASAGSKRTYGGITAYTDQLARLYSFEQLDLEHLVAGWPVGERCYITSPKWSVIFDPAAQTIEHGAFSRREILRILVDPAQRTAYSYEAEVHSLSHRDLYLRRVNLETRAEDWCVRSDDYQPWTWHVPGQSLLLWKTTGELAILDCVTGTISPTRGFDPGAAARSAGMLEADRVLLGDGDGTVRIVKL